MWRASVRVLPPEAKSSDFLWDWGGTVALPMDYLVELYSLLAKMVARLTQASLCPWAIL